jgi:hypothetical protein
MTAIALQDALSPPGKDTNKPSQKRRFSSSPFADDFDSENIDPSLLASPSKKAKGFDGTPVKTPTFSLVDAIPKPSTFSTPYNSPSVTNLKRKTLSLSVPTTTNATPIALSRGSPKHKRVGLLSKQRRFSSSPFRRVDPPSFGPTNGGLPFSIDAALSGTISSYKPAGPVTPLAEPILSARESKSMPASWFFDIHEDTPEEEAANLMEHSTLTLDISSDDDCHARRRKELDDRGKENVPPLDYVGPTPRRAYSAPTGSHKGIHSSKKALDVVEKLKDTMQEDRLALGALNAEDFYPDGLDGKSVVVVDAVPEKEVKLVEEHKTSKLSTEQLFEVTASSFVSEGVAIAMEENPQEEGIFVRPDSPERAIA